MKALPLIIILLLTKDTNNTRFIEGIDYTIHIFENEQQ